MARSGMKRRTDCVDIDKMVSSIRGEIDNYWLHFESANNAANLFSVHKVPQHIFGVDRAAYEPIILSIGPYHHGKESLQSMEKEKWNCLNFVLRSNCCRNLQDYLKVIARSERRARGCYSEEIKMEKKRFLQMLLLDGCFILVFLNGIAGIAAGNRGIDEGWNRFPLAIEAFDRPKQFHHLLHLCHMYFRPTQKFEEKHQGGARQRFLYRLLHFGRKYANLGQKSEDNKQLQTQQLDSLEPESIANRWRRWRRAVQYHEAGVTLKKREYDLRNKHSLLDLKFSNGVVEIPCLPIDENTEALFKNLIALEQTNPRYGNDLTAYISFMSQLVTTPDDAALLVKKGIIVHMMDSDEELSSLFTRLVKQVVIDAENDYYLKSLCQTLERHYQSRLNRWIAWLWLNHFSNPWLALAVLATIVMLICTVLQTIYTVLAYVKPLKQ